MIGDMDREESIAHLMKMRKGQARRHPPHAHASPTHDHPHTTTHTHPPTAPPRSPSLPQATDRFIEGEMDSAYMHASNLKDEELENRRDMGLVGDDIEKTIASRYGLGKDELEGNKEALMRRVNYKQHASKASRIFQSGPAWVG